MQFLPSSIKYIIQKEMSNLTDLSKNKQVSEKNHLGY